MDYPRLEGPLYAFPLGLGGFLLAAGVRYILDQPGVGKSFGVPPSVSVSPKRKKAAGDVYMTVAGIRVLFLGANILAFTLLRDRRATGVAVLGSVIVPIADGIVVFRHASKPLGTALGLHWVPAALTAFLAYKLLLPWCVFCYFNLLELDATSTSYR